MISVKSIQLFIPLILCLCTFSCAGKDHEKAAKNDSPPLSNTASVAVEDSFEVGKIISPVYCKNDASQSYALYIPKKGKNEALPVIYFFDPHGSGIFPLNKYKALADRYGFIFIGSNNSKNGNDGAMTEKIWNILVADTKARLKINHDRMYACGFSGGGKVACYVALQHPEIKGIIANGGALREITTASGFQFSFTAIAGEGDMNMTDLVSINRNLRNTTRHRIIFFEGKHEWAPGNTMSLALSGLQFDAMDKKLIALDEGLIRNYADSSRKKITAFLEANNYFKAEAECQLSISFLDGLNKEVNWFKQEDERLKNNATFEKQLKTQQHWLATEETRKNEFMKRFEQIDVGFWNQTASDLKRKAALHSDEGAMNERLLAYLSLAFYSFSNQLIAANRNQDAQYFVDLYKMVDPSNSEAWYFSAILDARNNNVRAAENDLLKAVSNGFTDKDRMRQQTEFRTVQVNFSGIESKMK